MNKSDLVQIRPYQDNDKNFIFATFLRGVYYGQPTYTLIPKDIFMSYYHKVLEFILKKPETKINIACLKEDNDVILGYSIMSDKAIHWAFVKKSWRGIGLANDLTPKEITTITHLSKIGVSVLNKRGLVYNPFLV